MTGLAFVDCICPGHTGEPVEGKCSIAPVVWKSPGGAVRFESRQVALRVARYFGKVGSICIETFSMICNTLIRLISPAHNSYVDALRADRNDHAPIGRGCFQLNSNTPHKNLVNICNSGSGQNGFLRFFMLCRARQLSSRTACFARY